MKASATICLLAPDRLLREGLCRILEDTEISVSGVATTLDEALEAIAAGAPPDLMLVDFSATDTRRLKDIHTLSQRLPQMRIVVLTEVLSMESLANCFAAGAHGYLVKSMSSAALRQSLALVMLGEKVFPTTLAGQLVDGTGVARQTPSRLSSIAELSAREIQVLQSLLTGNANKMIAHHLGVTESTVKAHLKGILPKIRARNRTQAALWAINNGLATSRSLPDQGGQ